MPSRISGSNARLVAAALALMVAGAAGAEVAVDALVLEMKPLDARVLFRKDPYDESSFPVTVRDPADPAAAPLRGKIEVKGSFTRRAGGKVSLLIKLEDGTWRGQSRLSFNGMGTDGSQMREWLAWDLMRTLGMVVPDTTYTRLSINGQDHGVFLRIGWIDPKLFEKAGRGGDGEMYHPDDAAHCGDLTPASLVPKRRCWLKLAPRGDAGFGSLRALIDEIAAEPVATFDRLVDRRFEADSVVNWFAVNALLSGTDTYNKNYFLYLSRSTGRWLIVPWDYDLVFGRAHDPYRPTPFSIMNDNFQYYYPVEAGQPNPLQYQSMKNPALRGRVLGRLRELIEGAPDEARPWRGWFAAAAIQRRIDALQRVLAPLRAGDPFLAGRAGRFEDEVAAVRHFAVARAQFLQRVALSSDSTWLPDQAEARLSAGATTHLTDGFGRLLASVTPRSAGALAVTVRRGRPELVPPGADRAACVQRTWLLDAAGALDADVLVEYLQEHSQATEVGPGVAGEAGLSLYARDTRGWWRLPTAASPFANTLRTAALRIPGAAPLRLVACIPAAPADLAAR